MGCGAVPTLTWPGHLQQPQLQPLQPESLGSRRLLEHNLLPHTQVHALPSICGAHPSLAPQFLPLPVQTFLSRVTSADASTSRKPSPQSPLFSLKLQSPKQPKLLMCPGQGLARVLWWRSPDPAPSVLGARGDRLTAVLLPRCAFFHGEVDKPAQGFLHRGGRKPVAVAISLEGVHVIDSREKVPTAPPGWDWVGGRGPHWRGRRALTQAFLVLLGQWLAWKQTGWLVWPPSLDVPGASSVIPEASLWSTLDPLSVCGLGWRVAGTGGGCSWDESSEWRESGTARPLCWTHG